MDTYENLTKMTDQQIAALWDEISQRYEHAGRMTPDISDDGYAEAVHSEISRRGIDAIEPHLKRFEDGGAFDANNY